MKYKLSIHEAQKRNRKDEDKKRIISIQITERMFQWLKKNHVVKSKLFRMAVEAIGYGAKTKD